MKKVLICGLGAVGMTYAVKLAGKCELKILVNKNRLERYKKNKPVFNGIEQEFEYIEPSGLYCPDIIIIATKADGLKSAVRDIKNFVKGGTIIISLLNGISSEGVINSVYPEAKVLKSYFIGHSAVREGNSVTQDGTGEIVIEKNAEIIDFFQNCGIKYSCPDNIDYAMWLKFTLNVFSNQVSAILNMNFGALKRNSAFIEFARKIIREVRIIAERQGVANLENLEADALNALSKMSDDGKTSMLQDIIAGRKTEVDIFAGGIIKMGAELGIPTPYNQVLYDLIKIKEEDNEYCIHSCQGRQ